MRTNLTCIAGSEVSVGAITILAKAELDTFSVIIGMALVVVVLLAFLVLKR